MHDVVLCILTCQQAQLGGRPCNQVFTSLRLFTRHTVVGERETTPQIPSSYSH